MAASPRKRQLSPRKRLPPTPFNQTWHETDTAHLDPSALPVARVPRAWERKCEVKQVGDGKAKSIWRRFSLRSSITNGQEEDETEEEEHEAQTRAVKRRQRMSPKAMEKLHGKKRAFKGTRWESGKSTPRRKRSAVAAEMLHEEQSDIDDTPDITDTDMSHENLDVPHDPVSFTFALDAAQTADELPDYESLDEQDDEEKLGNILLEDSTFALIFRSPVKGASTKLSRSPPKLAYPTLPHDSEDSTQPEISTEQIEGEDITVTGPSLESVVAEVVANVPAATTTYVVDNDIARREEMDHMDKARTSDIDANPMESAEAYTAADSAGPQPGDAEDVEYPQLPVQASDHIGDKPTAYEDSEDEEEDAEMSEIDLGAFRTSIKAGESESTGVGGEESEDVTEASLQLDIQEEYELEGELASQPPTPKPAVTEAHDIADGLTLPFTVANAPLEEQTPKKLHSPPPPPRIDSGPDDATMTLAIDDDTAILKSFLSRAAASKAERSAIITRRSSLENRRDSDVVRHALASPRKALEEMDPNSPTKIDSESAFTETLVQQTDVEDAASPALEQNESEESAEKAGRGSRRSSRAKKSRLPAPASLAQGPTANKIAIRRADGSDPVVLKKTDAQELALITRNNTRKNKQGAFMVSLRLLNLQAEAIMFPPPALDTEEKSPVPGRRGIRWDETLAYYQEHADTIASQEAEAASLSTPDELSLTGPVVTKKPKTKASTDKKTDKNSTPKVRRVKGLGTANGTPGKGLLATGSLLPDAVQEEKTATAAQIAPAPAPKGIRKPKVTRKLPVPPASVEKLPALEIAPVGMEPAKERKSRIAPPKSVKLPKPTSTSIVSAPAVFAAEKENKRTGISGATPRKGIPAPRIVAPKIATPAPATSVGVESALPRRRGRKV